jgi:uracil-DNA glycosylase
MPQIRVIVALGQIAFEGCLRLFRQAGHPLPRLKFGHGLHYPPSTTDADLPHLLACYHPSRQNTQTGRLTQKMIDEVFETARSLFS